MISVETEIRLPINKVWEFWNKPEHIKNWYFASDDWHAPDAENDLRTGGKFKIVMAAKDGSFGFDFEGKYLNVKEGESIEYVLADDRKVRINFIASGGGVKITESFDPESENSIELQRNGWQAILNNFKKYAEKQN